MSDNVRLESLKNLLVQDPNDGFLLFAIAKEYESIGQLDQALNHYEKLRTVDPDYVGLYYHLAALYQEMEDLNKALLIYDKGIEIAKALHDLHALSELKGAKMNLEMEM